MEDNLTTKERLICSACEIFAEKGYHDATVAEICEAAGANIAGVNYHFGDKSNLYRQAWVYLFEKSAVEHPLPGELDKIGPEAWLRRFIRSRVEEIFDTGICHRLPQLLYRVMSNHTEMNDHLFKTYLEPDRDRVRRAIKALLGPGVTERQLNVALINFMGLHIFLNVRHQKDKNHNERRHRLSSLADPAELSAQVEEFAIGGLLATRALIRSTEQ